MSVATSATLFYGSNRTGTSMIAGVGESQRYYSIAFEELRPYGLNVNVGSVELATAGYADANLILLQTARYSHRYHYIHRPAAKGVSWWNQTGQPAGSAILILTKRQGKKEERVSFRGRFETLWNDTIGPELAKDPRVTARKAIFTWEMFPDWTPHLNRSSTYLKITQIVDVEPGWPFSAYEAWFSYYVQAYVDSRKFLRVFGAWWELWVYPGYASAEIGKALAPVVQDGLKKLEDTANEELKALELLGPLTDVYFLPGNQTVTPPPDVSTGNTQDDITIVLEQLATP